jgi:hypothetical protein
MVIPIVSYRIAWNPQSKQGFVELTLQNRQTMKLTVAADEFVAIATVLNESPVFFNLQSRIIGTDWEQVGGA